MKSLNTRSSNLLFTPLLLLALIAYFTALFQPTTVYAAGPSAAEFDDDDDDEFPGDDDDDEEEDVQIVVEVVGKLTAASVKIKGTISDSYGPYPEELIYLVCDDEDVGEAESDDDGRFSFNVLRPARGSAPLTCRAEDDWGYVSNDVSVAAKRPAPKKKKRKKKKKSKK